jgi:ABC-type branched-subunit amino acid transport system substrate-binding protein
MWSLGVDKMICTQCGFANRIGDQICANCGSWLPETPGADGIQPAPSPFDQPAYLDGAWRDAEPSYGQGDYAIQQPPDVTLFPGAQTDRPLENGRFFPSPWQTPGAPAGVTTGEPARQNSGFQYPVQSNGSGFDYPTTGAPGYDYQQRNGVASAPLAAGNNLGLSPTPLAGPTGLGALLKEGRYRIIQPFLAQSGAAQPENEAPLLVAQDTEAPNTEVLLQELRFDGVPAQDAEYARYLTAQRLISLSYLQGYSRLIDSFSDHNHQYLVFEYPSGDLLSDRLRRVRGPLPETTAISIALQLLDVLIGAERERPPFVHGNLCPGNVVLRPSGQLTLVGMSPTLLLYPEGESAAGPAGGIAGYSAPEQSRGQASMRSDLLAVCAILYQAVTGSPPYTRASAVVQPAHRLNPAVSLELDEILNKGMRPSSAQRYQAAAELREALAPLAQGRHATYAAISATPDDPAALALERDERGKFVTPKPPLLQNPLFLIVSILALLAIIGGGVFYAISPHGTLTALIGDPGTDDAAAKLFQEKGIGISYGTRIFESSLANNTSKQQGARLLSEGNARGALEAFTRATVEAPDDPEAAIYAENARVLASQRPSVTLVAAIAYSANPQAPGQGPFTLEARSELQGVFLAQQRINSLNSLGADMQMRVLILNSGATPEDVPAASTILLNTIRAGNAQRIVGIIGWPETRQTQIGVSSLTASGLAILSPVANANGLGGAAASYFAVTPSINTQAGELADTAVKQLNARRVLIVADPNDPQENAWATAFAGRLASQYASTVTLQRREPYNSSAPPDFNDIALDAVNTNADLIYFTGDDLGALNLAHALARQFNGRTQRPHILLTSRDDVSALIGLGEDPVANAARKSPSDLSYLYVATPAHLDEWGQLTLSPPQVNLSALFTTQFGDAELVNRGVAPNATTILGFDATRMLALAAAKGLPAPEARKENWTVDPTAVRTSLRAFDPRHPFMGLGGAIGFAITGSQPQKALAILAFDQHDPSGPDDAIATATVFKVVGERDAFCGESSCQLTQ